MHSIVGNIEVILLQFSSCISDSYRRTFLTHTHLQKTKGKRDLDSRDFIVEISTSALGALLGKILREDDFSLNNNSEITLYKAGSLWSTKWSTMNCRKNELFELDIFDAEFWPLQGP